MTEKTRTKQSLLAEVAALQARVEALEARCIQAEDNSVAGNEDKYRMLFHSTPIPLLERDASALRMYLDELYESGITDVNAYLRENPQESDKCMKLIKTVEFNDAFLSLMEVDSREDLFASMPFMANPEELKRMALEIVPLIADRQVSREREVEILTGKGNKKIVLARALIVSGNEHTMARIVIALVDITARKKAEEALRISEQRFREQAMRDNLTGLYNRRYLYNSLSALIEKCKVEQTALSIIFMDLDNFKKVVDTYGHLNGSQAIREIAGTIQGTLKTPAYAVAYAGDEFVVVLPGHDSFQAMETASYLESRIKSSVYLQDAGLELKLQASFGIASFPDHADDITCLLASADKALFSVKENAKGGIKLADWHLESIDCPS